MLMYDPPGGWRWGFPKPYRPRPEEPLEATLIRDGYPRREVAEWLAAGRGVPCRFWVAGEPDAPDALPLKEAA